MSESAELQSTRTQIAFELHDNIIQTFIAADMRFEALRKSQNAWQTDGEFAAAVGLLRDGIADLRDLMERLRPRDIEAADLPDALASLVERFRRETIIDARLLVDPVAVALDPSTCRQLVRIAQEALNNVRRHSHAAHVVVRFRHHHGWWRLSIDEDGCGFPFEGAWSLDELDRDRRGPLVIKERVRDIGAELIVESRPGHGAKLEIIVPTPRHG